MQQYSLDCVEELTLKQLLMKSECLFAELKIKFLSSNNGVGRSIAKYSSLQHVLNVSFMGQITLIFTVLGPSQNVPIQRANPYTTALMWL